MGGLGANISPNFFFKKVPREDWQKLFVINNTTPNIVIPSPTIIPRNTCLQGKSYIILCGSYFILSGRRG